MTTSGWSECFPLGATVVDGGVNFSLFSRHASFVELLLFDRPEDVRPSRVVPISPEGRRYHYWHVYVPGVKAGQLYAYRVHGPHDPDRGLLFDADKVLLDPYGRAVANSEGSDRKAASRPGDNITRAMKSVVADVDAYDWEGDAHPRHSSARTILYELHVRGFTQHPSSGVREAARGTFAGLIEKIPYLRELGITAVQLMPIFQFDPQDAPSGKINYWGYAPFSFFAPHAAYSSRRDPLGPLDEFRDLVKALHRAGIEVILDVVFNHTAEGNERGPTLCLRGIDNPTYYLLEDGGRRYANYTGCGNTLRADHAVVRRMILDSLRYWVTTMHVDGFRFDLASVLARDGSGRPLSNPPILWDIESDPQLAGTKLIAEAWDAAGLYQVGSFVGDAWKELNGRFRDAVRDFFRGEPGALRRAADRILGSPEVYGHEQREAEQSVNFVTCHDGFTLNDLVSYDRKHNHENGENNRDGSDDNRSWNCGVEGPTEDEGVERLRNRQVKNFLTVNVLSLGVPLLGMGDEARRSQAGNNNAYCQDNELSWFDWSLVERHADVVRFVRLLNARRAHWDDRHERRRTPLLDMLHLADLHWHGSQLGAPDWGDTAFHFGLEGRGGPLLAPFFFMLNAAATEEAFQLPPVEGCWRRWIDTFLDSPQDITPFESAPRVEGASYAVKPHSVVVLLADDQPTGD